MKRVKKCILPVLMVWCMMMLVGCGSADNDPGVPPEEVIHPESQTAGTESSGAVESSSVGAEEPETVYDGELLENAVSVRIGQDGETEWAIDMYNNATANTMLDYLSGAALLFPTYTYDEEGGFVAQNVRGSYTRDEETEIADVHAGELYLFNGGQLRFYFKDVTGANITATPVGVFEVTEGLGEAVQNAYQDNLGDTWGVDVYFWLTKLL